jgi:hypothetical protein
VKKKVLAIIMVLSIVIMLLSFSTPVIAGSGNSVDIALSIAESYVYPEDTVHYTLTVYNNAAVPDANPAWVDFWFSPPSHTGAQGSYGAPIVIATDLYLTVGAFQTYNWDGSGGAIAVPQLAVDLGAIPLDAGVEVVYAAVNYHADYEASPAYNVNGDKDIPVEIINPKTQVVISSLVTTVPDNTGTTLTVKETNTSTGNDSLQDVFVQLSGGSTLKLERNSAYFVQTTDPVAPGTQNFLDPGESWTWEGIPTGILNANTIFTATGHGIDSLGTDITPPFCPTEVSSVTVFVEKIPPPPPDVPANSNMGTGIMIIGLGVIIGLLILRKTTWQISR